MALSNWIAGQASLNIGGQTVLLAGSFAYSVADYTRETLKGQDGVHGYKGMAKEGVIKCKLRSAGPGTSLAALTASDGISITCQLANGVTVSGDNMWRVGEPPELETEDGTFDLEFNGRNVVEN